jgi:hypothetical protein
MIRCRCLWVSLFLLLAFAAGQAQDDSAQAQQGTVPPPPVPAFGQGQDSASTTTSENPPISGLDMPNLEPHAAPLSYLQAGAHFSQSVDSNIENSLGGSEVSTITRLFGSLELQRLWSRYALGLEYVGGVGYYDATGLGWRQVQELGFDQKVTWKRGQFDVRDAFSYQPEGSFGTSYGGVGVAGAALGSESVFFGGTALGDLGQVPRIMNLALADVVEGLTPKSTITASGGYGFLHFLQDDPDLGNAFIGSSQLSGQVGYDRLLGKHDQAAIVYGYEKFEFSTGESFVNNLIQLMWGHRISGRMDFVIGAGPQFTQLSEEDNDLRISAAGRVELRYQFPRTYMDLSYSHFITSGSGFFAGAESDIGRLSVSRPLTRTWTGFSDIGYSRNSRVLPTTCPFSQLLAGTCPGVAGNVYKYVFAGAGMRRNFGRTVGLFATYQFNYLTIDSAYCGSTGGPCDRNSQRHVVTVGLDWTPRPWRLD